MSYDLNLASLGTATGTTVDSPAKHIMACKMDTNYLITLLKFAATQSTDAYTLLHDSKCKASLNFCCCRADHCCCSRATSCMALLWSDIAALASPSTKVLSDLAVFFAGPGLHKRGNSLFLKLYIIFLSFALVHAGRLCENTGSSNIVSRSSLLGRGFS